MSSIQRTCGRCHIAYTPSPKSGYCRSCNTERSKEWRHNNPENWKSIYAKANKKRRDLGLPRATAKPTIPRVCAVCGKDFLATKSAVKQNGAFTCSRACFHIRYSQLKIGTSKRKAPVSGLSYNWLHRWVESQLGKPKLCDACGRTDGWFDWANKSHEYKKDITDWIRLCRKCHNQYDNKGEKMRAIMLEYWKRKRDNMSL